MVMYRRSSEPLLQTPTSLFAAGRHTKTRESEGDQQPLVGLPTLNLHFCLRDKRFASILIGYSRPVRVAQNMEALTAEIDEAVWAELARDWM